MRDKKSTSGEKETPRHFVFPPYLDRGWRFLLVVISLSLSFSVCLSVSLSVRLVLSLLVAMQPVGSGHASKTHPGRSTDVGRANETKVSCHFVYSHRSIGLSSTGL